MNEVGVSMTLAGIGRMIVFGGSLVVLAGCAEVEVGSQALKSLNDSITKTSAPEKDEFAVASGSQINSSLEADPDAFETTGYALWDGARTLQGIWVAHPRAEEARRVRVFNTETGMAVDGALFRRDTNVGGPPILISSEAATALGLEPRISTRLTIVALKPATRTSQQVAEAETEEVETTSEIEETSLTETETTPDDDADRLAAATASAAATGVLVDEVAEETTTEEVVAETASDVADTETETLTEEVGVTEVVAEEAAVTETETVAAVEETTAPEPEAVAEASDSAAEATDFKWADSSSPAPEKKPEAEAAPEPVAEEVAEVAEVEQVTEVEEVAEVAEVAETPAKAENVEFNWAETAAAAPKPAAPAAKAASPAPQPAASYSSIGSGDLVVKAGVFGVKENADRLVEKIKGAGYPATGRSFTSGSRTLTSVVAGPFATSEQQAAALKAIRALGVPDAIASKG
ncbi:SPOR domain-containing protein [Rhodobacteraceae bacterium NNCM2]|nr:SPOR domain-containing protein [Coraliihabitans acroporae]